MAGYVPNTFRAIMLENLVGKTTVASTTLYLGLAVSVATDPMESTLSNIIEVTTGGYARKAIPTWGGASTTPPIQILETAAFSFNSLTADMTEPAYFAFMTAAVSGAGSSIRYIWELVEPIQGRTGEAINIPANSLIIE